jgi:hypothetical protein
MAKIKPIEEQVATWPQPDQKQLKDSEHKLQENGAGLSMDTDFSKITSPTTPGKGAGAAISKPAQTASAATAGP